MTEKAALTLEAMTTTSDTDFMLDRKHERKAKPQMYQKLFPFYSAHVSIKNSYGSETASFQEVSGILVSTNT